MKRIAHLLAVISVAAFACGGGTSDDPKGALVDALENMSESEGSELVISLVSTPEDLDALGREDGGSGIEAEDAQKILDSSLTMRTSGTGDDAQFEMVVNVAGEDDAEIKFLDKVLYLRADVPGLMETFGQDPAQLDVLAQQAEAQGMTYIRPAIEGEWLALEGFEELQQQISGGASPPAADQKKALEELRKSVEESATVTSEGDEEPGEHLLVTVPLRDVYDSFLEQAGKLGGGIAPLPPASQVPDEEIKLDVWVDDERITQFEFDFLQLAELDDEAEIPEGVDEMAIRITVDEFDDSIEAPDDAVAVDAQEVFGAFFGAAMGGAGGSTAPAPSESFDCAQLEGAPPAVLEQFADVCPELQN